jgi:hypothetical protein
MASPELEMLITLLRVRVHDSVRVHDLTLPRPIA